MKFWKFSIRIHYFSFQGFHCIFLIFLVYLFVRPSVLPTISTLSIDFIFSFIFSPVDSLSKNYSSFFFLISEYILQFDDNDDGQIGTKVIGYILFNTILNIFYVGICNFLVRSYLNKTSSILNYYKFCGF